MTNLFIVLGGLLLFFLVSHLIRQRRISHTPVIECTYWVFLPVAELPSVDALMKKVSELRGDQDLKYFSDVRLHIGIASRAKNPHIFRPDVCIEEDVDLAPVVRALANSHGRALVRFISNEPMPNFDYLSFCACVAAAIASLSDGLLIIDIGKQHAYRPESLMSIVNAGTDLRSVDFNVSLIWQAASESAVGYFEGAGEVISRGLKKIGLPELSTYPMPSDMQRLGIAIMQDYVESAWNKMQLLPKFTTTYYEDEFAVSVTRFGRYSAKARIFRRQDDS